MTRHVRRILGVACALSLSAALVLQGQQPTAIPAADDADQPIKTTVVNSAAVAVVIGISKYQDRDIPPATFAGNDADAVARVLTQTLGYSSDRVLVFKNEQVSSARLKAAVRQRLAGLVQSGKSDVFFYFSGHGEPNTQTKDGYLIPWDFAVQDEPNADNAYAVKELRADLAKLNARTVTIVLEACFTGQSKSGPLIKGARPLVINVESAAQVLTNGVVIAASGPTEIASDHPQRPHGLMTYYWLRAMRGEAADDQGRVTSERLKQYLQREVPRVAGTVQRSQMPEIVASQPAVVLARLPVSSLRTGDARVVERTGTLEVFIDLGGDLFIDGIAQGTIAAGRVYVNDKMPAGRHTIEIRKDNQTKREDVVILPDQKLSRNYLFSVSEPVSTSRVTDSSNAPSMRDAATVMTLAEIANKLAAANLREATTGMEFVRIQPGEFMMGCSTGDTGCEADEKPAHRVRITKGFDIGKYEVTQAQWEAVMGSNPSRFKGANRPVEEVSWNDAQQFLQKLNARQDGYRYRLPTEAEWEYAARAGTSGAYAGSLDAMGWYDGNSGSQSHPVGQKQPNAWGLHDLHGNVYEWVQDWYGNKYYAGSPQADPTGPASGGVRVVRGGYWSGSARNARVSVRLYSEPNKGIAMGFRCVREAIR